MAGLGFFSAPAAVADTGNTPGTYTYYSFPSGTGSLHDATWTTTPAYDPGYTSDIFWAHQFQLDSQQTAYIGMQSNGGSPRLLLFSVWGATDSKPGPGSTCSSFSEGSDGQSCRAHLDWQAGHTYRFAVTSVGQGWFDGSVTDATSGSTIDLGSVKTTAAGISPAGMVDWTEYFEWNDPRSTCYDQPGSTVTMGLPQGNGGAVTASVSGTSVTNDPCKPMSQVDTTPRGSIQRNDTGNTARGSVQNGQSCLSATVGPRDGARTAMSTCAATTDRAWVYAADRTLRMKSNYCLADQNSTALVRDCAGAPGDGKVTDPAKQWTYDPVARTLRNQQSARCLTAAPDGTTTTQACTGGAGQVWSLPALNGVVISAAPGTISGQQSGRCLDIKDWGTADGTPTQLWDCAGGWNQLWQQSNGTIVNPQTGKCLDVSGGSTANGARVQLWSCNGTGAQQWTANPNGTLTNPQSGKCLDAAGSGNGSVLQIWDCYGGGGTQANQVWSLK